MDKLAHLFEEELKDKMLRAKKECKYNPTRFNQMLARYGGVETARRLIDTAIQTGNTSDGFTTLLLCNRLDLTMEHSVCKPEYKALFSERQISATENPIYTEIVIADNGSGFSAEDLPHLFDRFYRGSNAKQESAGIGLNLARMIITKQNGIIKAQNCPEGGAQFIIRFYKGAI